MLRRLVAILLIVTVTASGFTRFAMFASFKINQKYIAENLCENRDKPWLHCEGKCFLMKKLKQAEEKEQQQEHLAQKNLIQTADIGQSFQVRFYTRLLEVISIPLTEGHPLQYPPAVFHPPETTAFS